MLKCFQLRSKIGKRFLNGYYCKLNHYVLAMVQKNKDPKNAALRILTPQNWLFWVYLPLRNTGPTPFHLRGFNRLILRVDFLVSRVSGMKSSLRKLMVLSLSWLIFCNRFGFARCLSKGDLWMFETASPYIFCCWVERFLGWWMMNIWFSLIIYIYILQ